MIKYVHGDLLKGGDDVIVHGCNCICTMGAGIALQIKKTYPEAYRVDQQTQYGDRNKLGTYTKWTGTNKYFPDKQVTVVNAYTQFHIFSKYGIPLDYDAVEDVCKLIKVNFYHNSIGMCKIGSGLAGGDWKKIERIINKCFEDKEITVYFI